MSKKIHYIAAIHKKNDAGIVKKIESTIGALADKGYAVEAYFAHQDGYRGVLQLRHKIRKIKTDMIILRSCRYYSLLLFMTLWAKRRTGTRIVIDIPTPIVNLLFEIWGQRKNVRGALLRISLIVLSLPWSHWVAHRVIQYGIEHPWFLLGLRRKTILVGNGVRLADIPKPITPPSHNGELLVLIGVAKLFFWHGFDRVIRGIAEYESSRKSHVGTQPAVIFVIVGDGPERAALELLVDRMSIEHRVRFEGYQGGDRLMDFYHAAHIAISSLGLHRQNLKLASPLKAREYLGMGLPIVFSYTDPDVPDDAEFVFKVSADDSPLPIAALVDWYLQLRQKNVLPWQPRENAEQHLDFAVKTAVYEGLLGQMPTQSGSAALGVKTDCHQRL